jgi:hypothetical protein
VDAAMRAVDALATGAPLADLLASLTPERKGS